MSICCGNGENGGRAYQASPNKEKAQVISLIAYRYRCGKQAWGPKSSKYKKTNVTAIEFPHFPFNFDEYTNCGVQQKESR